MLCRSLFESIVSSLRALTRPQAPRWVLYRSSAYHSSPRHVESRASFLRRGTLRVRSYVPERYHGRRRVSMYCCEPRDGVIREVSVPGGGIGSCAVLAQRPGSYEARHVVHSFASREESEIQVGSERLIAAAYARGLRLLSGMTCRAVVHVAVLHFFLCSLSIAMSVCIGIRAWAFISFRFIAFFGSPGTRAGGVGVGL